MKLNLLWGFLSALAYDCIFKAPGGEVYDLSPLMHHSPPDYSAVDTNGNYEFRGNVCKAAFQSCAGDFTGVATQWDRGGGCIAVLGREDPEYGGLSKPLLSYIDEYDPTQGVVLTYRNGDLCFAFITFEREVQFVVRCDENKEAELLSASEPEMCAYRFEFLSKAGCAPGSMQTHDTKEKADSGFTRKKVLLWTAIALVLYCVIGATLNRGRTGESWSESVPNKTFWLQLFSLTQDCVSLLAAKLRRLNGSATEEGRISL